MAEGLLTEYFPFPLKRCMKNLIMHILSNVLAVSVSRFCAACWLVKLLQKFGMLKMSQRISRTDLFVFASWHEKLEKMFLNSSKMELSFIELFEFCVYSKLRHTWNEHRD